MDSKLTDGCIPPHTECPFRKECGGNIQNCDHQGVSHAVPYSCGLARGFEIVHESKDKKEK